MADIYARVKLLEKKLEFVMTSMRMKGAVSSGLLGPDGQPSFRTIEGSLEDFYQMSRMATEVINESDEVLDAVIEADNVPSN